MSNTRNAGVAGGVVLLMLWGGIGFFFGKGKGKGDGEKKATKANLERRVEPRRDGTPRRQPPTPVRRTPDRSPARAAAAKPETYSYVLRLKFIHPVLPGGKVSDKTITLEELIAKGKAAKADKKELHLKIRGDAKAIWLNRLKHKLKVSNVAYSISDDS